MQTLNNQELAFLSMLGHRELTEKALRAYAAKMYLFTEMFMPHLNIMWNAYVAVLKKYKRQYGLNVGHDIVAAELAASVQASPSMPEQMRIKCDGLLKRLVAGEYPDIEQGTVLLRQLMENNTNRQLMEKLNANPDLDVLRRTLEASGKLIGDLTEPQESEDATGVVYNPLREIEKLATKSVRIPTGVNFLDAVSGGGGRAGDAWLILGAPSGGKSALAVQWSCSQVMLGRNVLWATFEQSLEGDLAERMIANITDTSLDSIRDVGFANLPKDVQDRFWSATGGVMDRLVGLDMTKIKLDHEDPMDYGGVYSVKKQFMKLKAEGRKPDIVIMDWFGAMMSIIAANKGLDLASCYRFEAQKEINQFLKFIKEEKVLGVWFHQLDVKAASSRPTYLADATHAQDMHNLQNFFDMVLILGIKDVNNVCYLSNPKARKGGRVTCTLRLIGDRARFVKEDGWLPNRDGNFYKPGNMSGGKDAKVIAAEYSRELD